MSATVQDVKKLDGNWGDGECGGRYLVFYARIAQQPASKPARARRTRLEEHLDSSREIDTTPADGGTRSVGIPNPPFLLNTEPKTR